MSKHDVRPEAVIEAWQTSDSAAEAAEKLGMPKAILVARVSGYRAMGIPLKKMPRKFKQALDVEALAGLARSLSKEETVESTAAAREPLELAPGRTRELIEDLVRSIHQPAS